MIMKPVELQCVIGGPCKFKTIKLEFAQAFQLLKLHMKYLHSPKANGGRDEISNEEEDLEEENFEIEQLYEETEEAKVKDLVIEEIQSDFAGVTSVLDDRSTETNLRRPNHDSKPVEVSRTNFADVTLVIDDRNPVETHKACDSCGRNGHSSHRTSRRKFCSAWNKFCWSCNGRGHFQRVCKATIEEDFDEFEDIKEDDDELSFGEIAPDIKASSEDEESKSSTHVI